MNENYLKALQQIIEQLEEDKKNAQIEFNKNLDSISEINVNLKTLHDKEKYDFSIFSPRKVDNTDNNSTVIYNEEKNKLEENNREYYEKICKLNSMLSTLYSFRSEDGIYSVVPKKNQDNQFNSFVLLEADRQRIAKDLHDTSLQNLTAIIHKIELASMYINQDPIRAKLELTTISNSIKDTINEIRDTIFELRPMTFDDFGFRELLDAYIVKETEKNSINVIFDKYCFNIKDQAVLLFAFRVIKECLNNSVKHSQCSEIHLVIDDSSEDKLFIDIVDNGTGFDIENKNFEKNKHFGLIIVKERVKLMNGTIDMKSNENGTVIHIVVPINKH